MAFGANFAAQVDDWVKKSEKRMLAIYRESVKRTVSIAQSRIPIDTGFARASVRASMESMPQIDPSFRGDPNLSYPYSEAPIVLVIAQADLNSPLFIGWTAAYVPYLENGSSKQAPSGFIRLAAMQWPQTVSAVVAEAKSRVAAAA